ncbi:OmpA family protein [Lewinella sp. W8]|uniref:OmpA family protein n=1 Tax=Lewinella sp. W8 TaxID=2528208 RepID=UPI001566C1EF|nr:OmpA family protein [Lewinella sp. W8]
MNPLKIALLLFLITLGFGLAAQEDVPGAKDHPLLSRYPGSHIAWYQTKKYVAYDLATGPITRYRHIEDRQEVAGQLYRIYYEIEGAPAEISIDEVYADYLRAFERAGATILNQGLRPKGNDFGGSQWVGVALAPQSPPNSPSSKLFAGTSSSGGKFALAGRIDRPTGPVYVAIYGERHSNKLVNYLVDIIETKDAELGKVSLNPEYIMRELTERGTVSVYGIKFAYDSAEILPDSEETLKQIAAFLKANPGIKLYVVGHTDNQGEFSYNHRLSQRRAAATVKALEDRHGIASGRLLSEGVAFLAPKATNKTEEGRALNRRVELVLRP